MIAHPSQINLNEVSTETRTVSIRKKKIPPFKPLWSGDKAANLHLENYAINKLCLMKVD